MKPHLLEQALQVEATCLIDVSPDSSALACDMLQALQPLRPALASTAVAADPTMKPRRLILPLSFAFSIPSILSFFNSDPPLQSLG
jgi:hypothetical protein